MKKWMLGLSVAGLLLVAGACTEGNEKTPAEAEDYFQLQESYTCQYGEEFIVPIATQNESDDLLIAVATVKDSEGNVVPVSNNRFVALDKNGYELIYTAVKDGKQVSQTVQVEVSGKVGPYLTLKKDRYDTAIEDSFFVIPTEDISAKGLDGEEVNVSFAVTHDGESVKVENGAFETPTKGMYEITVTATDAEGYKTEKKIDVECYDRDRNIIYDFEQSTDQNNFYTMGYSGNAVDYQWVSYSEEGLPKANDGGMYALKFTPLSNSTYPRLRIAFDRLLPSGSEISFQMYCDAVGHMDFIVQSANGDCNIVSDGYGYRKWFTVTLQLNQETQNVEFFVNLSTMDSANLDYPIFEASSTVDFYLDNFIYTPKILCNVEDNEEVVLEEEEEKYYLEDLGAGLYYYHRNDVENLQINVYEGKNTLKEPLEILKDENGEYFVIKKSTAYTVEILDQSDRLDKKVIRLLPFEWSVIEAMDDPEGYRSLILSGQTDVTHNMIPQYVYGEEQGSACISFDAAQGVEKFLKFKISKREITDYAIIKCHIMTTVAGGFAYGWDGYTYFEANRWYEIKLIRNDNGKFAIYFDGVHKVDGDGNETQALQSFADLEFYFLNNTSRGNIYISNVYGLYDPYKINVSYVASLIDALPDATEITSENAENVMLEILEIESLYKTLSEADKAFITDMEKIEALRAEIKAVAWTPIGLKVKTVSGLGNASKSTGIAQIGVLSANMQRISQSSWTLYGFEPYSIAVGETLRWYIFTTEWTHFMLQYNGLADNVTTGGADMETWAECRLTRDADGTCSFYYNGRLIQSGLVGDDLSDFGFCFVGANGPEANITLYMSEFFVL